MFTWLQSTIIYLPTVQRITILYIVGFLGKENPVPIETADYHHIMVNKYFQ